MTAHYRVAVPSAKIRPAGDQARPHSRRRRHAAPAAPRRRREGARRHSLRRAVRRARRQGLGRRRRAGRRGAIARGRGRLRAQAHRRAGSASQSARPAREDRRRRAAIRRSSTPSARPTRVSSAASKRGRRRSPSVKNAVDLPFDEGIAREREMFLALLASPQSKAQRYVFFAERQAAKIADIPANEPTRAIRERRRHRRRHDGRRHRDELPQRRHSRDDRRDPPRGARPRPADHPRATTRTPPRRAA